MRPPLLSIITVTYNAELTIKKTIESVVNQTFSNYELIVIDGKSSDNTLSVLNDYKPYISQLIVEPDRGIYDAMNKGINLAQGEYITFMNSGDYYVDEKILEKVSSVLDKGYKLVYGDSIIFNNQMAYVKELKAKPINDTTIKVDFPVCHQSVFVRREIINLYDISYKIKSDYKWLIDITRKIDETEIFKIESPIVYYEKDGFSHKHFKTNLKELILLHYREFGWSRVILNTGVYLFRILRHMKDLVVTKIYNEIRSN